ncbi:transglutaminase TgpA family protein [Numidum massiliense]|uniref:transglutaminase TgpA family protein n=1 Tax=Numidum massiliense TaxID=1522315 RepID=UPI0006D56F4A|nr:transglutaminaseTgpA domain-containing protein [Numidum massiliense]
MRKFVRLLFYGAFSLALFYEWMKPLKQYTDTVRIDFFVIAFTFLLLLDMLRLPWPIRVVLKPLFLLFLVHHLFMDAQGIPFLGKQWLLTVADTVSQDVALLRQMAWLDMSPLIRTISFFFFIWLLEVVMYRDVVRRGRIFWLLLLTVVYLAVLDSFTPFDGSFAIVRTMSYGFFMLAFSRLDQLRRRSRSPERRQLLAWFSAALALIVCAVSIGYYAPKSEASWPNPVPFITSYNDKAPSGAGGTSTRKIGYGGNDSYLGGSFTQDETVVFEATVDEPFYWRGEAKDRYDGHGWFQSHERRTVEKVPPRPLFQNMQGRKVKQQVTFTGKRKYPVLFTAGQLMTYDAAQVEPEDAVLEVIAPDSGYRNANDQPFARYEIGVEQPLVNEAKLRQSGVEYPQEITAKYLQLPQKLPRRIKQLAEETVKGKTPYDRVLAVESFLKHNPDLTYETETVAETPQERDFVDQFLFDTQQGYCDHFSTSMVVLLRANGIPARWVKGFAPGERSYDSDNERYEVTVKNLHAHSWVEVYFPDVGWLPFEPTPGFYSPVTIEKDEDVNVDELFNHDGMEAQQPDDLPKLADFPPPEEAPDNAPEYDASTQQANTAGTPWKWWVASGAALFALTGVGWWIGRRRFWRWRLYALQRALQREGATHRKGAHGDEGLTTDGRYNKARFVAAYEQLLQLLEKRYGERTPDQSVRDYIATSLAWRKQDRDELIDLTRLYEASRYGDRAWTREMWQTAQDLWKKFLKGLRP